MWPRMAYSVEAQITEIQGCDLVQNNTKVTYNEIQLCGLVRNNVVVPYTEIQRCGLVRKNDEVSHTEIQGCGLVRKRNNTEVPYTMLWPRTSYYIEKSHNNNLLIEQIVIGVNTLEIRHI